MVKLNFWTNLLTNFCFCIRWMPESARWLIAKGKFEEAQMYLKKCAKMNGAEESSHFLNIEVCMPTEQKA